MDPFAILRACAGFEWDRHNAVKIWPSHQVFPAECEEIFFNQPLVVADDQRHSVQENRYYALGHTDSGRRLFAVFTVGGHRIRVISARDMSRRERKVFDSHEEEAEIQE